MVTSARIGVAADACGAVKHVCARLRADGMCECIPLAQHNGGSRESAGQKRRGDAGLDQTPMRYPCLIQRHGRWLRSVVSEIRWHVDGMRLGTLACAPRARDRKGAGAAGLCLRSKTRQMAVSCFE
jgi:hypothetical protein